MSNATPATAQSHSAAPAPTPRPSDDEILGVVTAPASAAANSNAPSTADLDSSESDQGTNAQLNSPPPDPAQFRTIFESNPELRDAWRDAQSFREIFPDVESARAIQKLFPTLEDARAANAQVADLARLDTLFFSNRPESHAELAAAIYRLNPTAFRDLVQMMNAIGSPVGEGVQTLPPRPPANATVQSSRGRETGTIAPNANGESNALSQPVDGRTHGESEDSPLQQPITAAHEHAFFHETNAAAVEGVLNSIQSQLDRLLPEGTPQNTRQRLTGEIYREVDAALQSNRAFGQQLRQAFRSGELTPENQRAIVGMVIGRAKQALPGIAKRVLGEWTSGVVAHAGARQERQRNAAKRVDIAGGAPGGDSPRALMPKDIDYRRMSDNDILNL
jgi:hypothetical protein